MIQKGLALRQIDGVRGRIQALTGSTALIIGRSKVPATKVLLILESDPTGRWPVAHASNEVIKASMRVGSSDRYRFAVVGTDDRVYLETVWRDVVADTDAAPTVQLIRPSSDVQVHPEDQIAIAVEATDDFGIEAVELVVEPLVVELLVVEPEVVALYLGGRAPVTRGPSVIYSPPSVTSASNINSLELFKLLVKAGSTSVEYMTGQSELAERGVVDPDPRNIILFLSEEPLFHLNRESLSGLSIH